MPLIPFSKDLIRSRGFTNVLRGGLQYLFGKRGKRLISGLRLFYGLRIAMLLRTGETFGKLTRNNEVRVWVDGEEAFQRIERLLGRAKHSILIQMFIWKDDETGRRMAHVVVAAANRGVMVTITKEAVGDLFELQGDFVGTKYSSDPIWKSFWSHPRIRVLYGTQNDHAKVYVIDDQILLLTGMNIADEYRYHWHDYMVELRGSAFVVQFLTQNTRSVDDDHTVELVMNTSERKEIRPTLTALLDEARESVIIEHCYVSDPQITEQLIALSKRDVRVTMIVPSYIDFFYHANMLTIGRLIAESDGANLRVLLYPKVFHGKIILVDHHIAFLGSANLMTNSIDEMGEVNVILRGKQRALHRLREVLRDDALKSRAITSIPPFLWVSRWLAWIGL